MNSTPPVQPNNPVPYPNQPSPISTPNAPNYGDYYQTGVQNSLTALPGQVGAVGDAANYLTSANTAAQAANAPELNQIALGEVQAADPTGYGLRQDLGSSLDSDLNLGSQLDPKTLEQIQQASRGSAAAYGGNINGMATAVNEAITTGQAGLALKNQRQTNAQNYLNGRQVTDQINNVPSTPFMGTVNALSSPILNSGNEATGFGANVYGDLTNQYDAQLQQQNALYSDQSGMFNSGLNYGSNNYRTAAGYEDPTNALLGTLVGAGVRGAAGAAFPGSSIPSNYMQIPRATPVFGAN